MSPAAPVAQPDRAIGFEPIGRGFESLRARQSNRGSMRNLWLAFAICIPSLSITSLIAAEKSRDWQSGVVVESPRAQTDPKIHAIAAATRTYIVRGTVGGAEDALDVGATVRFAVQGATMFLSLDGSEYKLSVLGATVRTAPPSAPVAAAPVAPVQTPAPAPKPPAVPSPPAATAAKPPAPVAVPAPAGEPSLDNDAIVKMIVGGLKEDTVVSVIQARPGKYSLGADALSALKAAGVTQPVIAAMSAKMNAQH
jgi:hypothetical protein